MDVNLYLISTVKTPKPSDGIIGFVIEIPTSGEPATKSQFYRVNSTKNQSQIMILNIALSHLKKNRSRFSIYADFEYLESAFLQGWIEEWEKNGWKNAKNEPVANAAMWQETLILLNGNEIEWHTKEDHSYKSWMETQTKEE